MSGYTLNTSLDNNVLTVEILLPLKDSFEYAYYLYKDGERIATKWYSNDNLCVFTLTDAGAYYVTCFVKNKDNAVDLFSQNSNLIMFPAQEMKTLTDDNMEAFAVETNLKEDVLSCRVLHNFQRDCHYEFAFYLIEENRKIVSTGYSPYNGVKFSLPAPGIYSVKCFIKSEKEVLVKNSKLHGYKCEDASVENTMKDFTSASTEYIQHEEPYTDFCLVMSQKGLGLHNLLQIRQRTKLHWRRMNWTSNSKLYLIGNRTTISKDTIVSGIVNEGNNLIWGQKNVELLNSMLAKNMNPTTMTGKFTLYLKQERTVTITHDYFGLGTIFYYYDGKTAIISNRLNLLLFILKIMDIDTKINFEYIAATMTFNDRLISGTNFSNELAIKNLHILSLNQYIEITPNDFKICKKNINYQKTTYNEDEYLNLLNRAKEDMLQKLKNIMQSKDITHYKMSLSGGFDSRLNLAVLLNSEAACKNINVSTKDVTTSNDLKVSLWLTNYFKIPYVNLKDYKMKNILLTVQEFILRYLNFNSGIYHTLHEIPGTITKSDVGQETINIVGMLGETMRSRYYLATRDIINEKDSVSQIVNKLLKKLDSYRMSFVDETSFYNILCKEIECTPGQNAYEKFDNLNTFYQLRYHLNNLNDKAVGDGQYYSLFMSPYMFEASRMLTMEERSSNKIMLDMCYILCPAVLAFPYSSYGSSDSELTKEHWGNVIFAHEKLPNIELDDDQTGYDRLCKELNDLELGNELENNIADEMYSQIMVLYNDLTERNDIGNCFDENLYWYIQSVKSDKKKLAFVFSKMLGIWQQVSIV